MTAMEFEFPRVTVPRGGIKYVHDADCPQNPCTCGYAEQLERSREFKRREEAKAELRKAQVTQHLDSLSPEEIRACAYEFLYEFWDNRDD